MSDLFTKDLGWKLFSLFLAAAIWLTVNRVLRETNAPAAATVGTTLTYGNLPVLVVSRTADVRDFLVAPAAVSVTVSGSPDVMSVLQANQIRATVDLTGIEPDKESRRRVDVSAPPGVTLVSVEPPRVGVIAPQRDKKP